MPERTLTFTSEHFLFVCYTIYYTDLPIVASGAYETNNVRYPGLGLIAGLIWLYTIAHIPMRSLLLFAVLMSSMIAAIAAWRYVDRKVAGFAAGFALALTIGVISTVYIATTVMRDAKASASGRPFCIQVASPSDYAPAGALLDLSPLTMRATTVSGHSMTHHAILVVADPKGAQLFHWSYRRRQFVRGTVNDTTPGYGPAVVCEPDERFARRLPILIGRPANHAFVRFSDREAYRISLTYRPRWSGGPNRYLAFQATSPDFAPSPSTTARRDDVVLIQWSSTWLTSLLQAPDRAAVLKQDSAYGLTRQTLEGSHTRYVSNSDAGVTLIDCYGGGNSSEPSCQHRFLDGPRHIAFRHRAEDVPNWRELQTRLVARLASFGAAAAPTPPSSRP